MNTITRLVLYTALFLTTLVVNAQDNEQNSRQKSVVDSKISKLEQEKSKVEENEKLILKLKITKINKRLDKNEITAEEAQELKREAAENTALNIENRIDIIEKKIDLLKRNGYDSYQYTRDYTAERDTLNFAMFSLTGTGLRPSKYRKYDRRTTSDLVFAIGFNNALIDGQSLDDSPYKIGGSGFVELGYAWKTRIFDNTNFWRFKYGLSFQWNKLNIKDNQYFVNNDGVVGLEDFRVDLDKAKFRTTNLVVPLHLEFGPSKKTENKDYFRYSTTSKFKMGLGGYAGLNIGSKQKLKFKEDGERQKDKQRGDFETSDFIYGLSGYVAFGGVALYVKYDLNPIFKDQAIDQNNISLGLRFDMD